MEPIIYKPSIYKGAGIYKTGAEGGGGGDDTVEIGGRIYKTTTINGVTWLAENLAMDIEGAIINPSSTSTSNVCIWYKPLAVEFGYGYLYNKQATRYLQLYNNLPDGWNVATKNDYDKLINFVGGINNFRDKFCNKNWIQTSDDEYKFDILPAGYATSDIYDLSLNVNGGSAGFITYNNDLSSDTVFWVTPSSCSYQTNAAGGGRSIRLVKNN